MRWPPWFDRWTRICVDVEPHAQAYALAVTVPSTAAPAAGCTPYHDKFIASEPRWARGWLTVILAVSTHPFARTARLTTDASVNYLVHLQRSTGTGGKAPGEAA
jgi:hypothetical protein